MVRKKVVVFLGERKQGAGHYDKDGRMTDLWEKTPNSGIYYHSVATFFENGVVKTVQIANPSQYTQTYAIDGKGRPTSMSSSASGGVTVVSSATYNAASQPTNIAIGTSTDYDGYTYDSNTGRMTGWTFQVGTTPKTQTATLNWNPIGTLRSLAITDGFYSGATQTCNFGDSSNAGYDDWNRLVRDDCGSGGWGQTFSYDQYNNLTKAVISGRTGTTFNPGYNSANNQFASGFGASYDSNGNLTYDTFHHYEWDEFSKVKSFDRSGTNCATSGQCLVYDALGRMVEIDSGATKTEILYTQLGKTGYLTGSTLNYAYWPTPGGGTLLQIGGVFDYEHKDWLGSSRISSGVLSDNIVDDRAFSPYGELYATFGSTAQNQNIFTGDTQDVVSGTYDTPNRELSIVGRWINPDPAGAGWNQYAYATNPNTFIDPTGMNLCVGNIATCFQGSGFRGNPGPGQSAATGSDPFFGSASSPVGGDSNPSGEYTGTYEPSGWNGGQQGNWIPGVDSEPVASLWITDLLNSFTKQMPFLAACQGPGTPCHLRQTRSKQLGIFSNRGYFFAAGIYEYEVVDESGTLVAGTQTTEWLQGTDSSDTEDPQGTWTKGWTWKQNPFADQVGFGPSISPHFSSDSIDRLQEFSVQVNGAGPNYLMNAVYEVKASVNGSSFGSSSTYQG